MNNMNNMNNMNIMNNMNMNNMNNMNMNNMNNMNMNNMNNNNMNRNFNNNNAAPPFTASSILALPRLDTDSAVAISNIKRNDEHKNANIKSKNVIKRNDEYKNVNIKSKNVLKMKRDAKNDDDEVIITGVKWSTNTVEDIVSKVLKEHLPNILRAALSEFKHN